MHNLAENIEVNSDFSLIEKICLGEIALFEVLIRRYNPVLYKIARSYGFNHQDAEDLMQETHVAAYLALSKFEGRSSYKTWVSRIMVNKCLYKLKYGSCKNEVSSEPSSFTLQSMDKKAQTNPTEQTLLNREFAVILEQSLQRLPVQYRTVFVLRALEGFSVAETASLLNITPVNVKVRLNRAKALLQGEIEQFYTHTDIYAFNLIYCDAIVKRVFEQIDAIRKKGQLSDDSITSI